MRIEVGGCGVSYELYGEKGGDVVVLHGWASNAVEWRNLAQLLCKSHRVWLINLPGFGGSDELKEQLSLEQYGEFVQKILNELHLESFTLIGHSFGGRVAIALSAIDSRVKKLVLVDAAGMAMPGLKVFLYGWLLKLMEIYWNVPVVPKKYIEHLTVEDVERSKKMLPLFSRVVSADISKLLSKIKIPVLVVWGLWDMALPVWEGIWLYKKLPNATFRLLPYSSHVPHVEETNRLVKYLKKFGI